MEQSIKLFVPLGTQKFPFTRLVEILNKLVNEGIYSSEEIVMQASVYEVEPLFRHYNLIPNEEFNAYINNAEVVITHSGVNSIISCMNLRKNLIIVPRMKCYGEHVDDHQLEIAELMESKFDVIVVRDMSDLQQAIDKAKTHKYKSWSSKNSELIEAVKRVIGE